MFDTIHTEYQHVHTYELDRFESASLSYIFQLMQEAAAGHSSEYDLTVSDLKQQMKTWVVTKQRVRVHRYPRWKEQLRIETWVTTPTRIVSPRSFRAFDADGELIFEGLTYWCIIDLDRHRPVPIASVAPFTGIGHPDRKITEPIGKPGPVPEEYPLSYEYQPRILYRDTDNNGHVNNGIYCDWCLDSLPAAVRDALNPEVFEIHYISETYEHEQVTVRTSTATDHRQCYHRIFAEREGREVQVATAKSVWARREKLL
jgi:medium-chain acyl-[acyl-carrier-protein] hydrolase